MRGSSVDDSGAVDMPMRLIIAAVLTSLTLPVLWGAYSDLSDTVTEGSMKRELSRVLRCVDEVMSGGPGSSLELTVDLTGFGTSRVEEVLIGGPLNSTDGSSFRIEAHVGDMGDLLLALDPPVLMTSSDGQGLRLGPGVHGLRIGHESINGHHYAVVVLDQGDITAAAGR